MVFVHELDFALCLQRARELVNGCPEVNCKLGSRATKRLSYMSSRLVEVKSGKFGVVVEAHLRLSEECWRFSMYMRHGELLVHTASV